MVVALGNINVQKLLTGDAAGLPAVKIGVGTSSTPVDAADTALTGAVIKAVDNLNYLPGNVVEFRGTLAAGDPAMTVQEIGLYDASNVLLFRKVIPARIKTAGVSASIYYRIKVQ